MYNSKSKSRRGTPTVKMLVFGLILMLGALLAFDLMPDRSDTQGNLRLKIGADHFEVSREVVK